MVGTTNKTKRNLLSIIVTIILSLSTVLLILNSTRAELPAEDGWRLEITGLVQNPLNLTLSELQAMPNTTVQATIYCVDFPNYVVEEGNWTGVRVAYLLELAGTSPTAIKIAFFAADGYSTDLTIGEATQPEIIIAYEKDGTVTGTIRLVVPGRWGYKWITQLEKIEPVNYDFKGKWESRGYDDAGIGLGPTIIPEPIPASIPPPLSPSQTPSQNTTTTKPTEPTPAPSSSSNNQAPQETQEDTHIPQEPQNPQDSITSPIAALIIISVAIAGTTLALYSRKRKKHSPLNLHADASHSV